MRERFVDTLHFLQHGAGNFDGVGARLLSDGHPNTPFPVNALDLANTLMGIQHLGHLTDGDGGLPALGQHRVADLIDTLELGRGTKTDLVPILFDLTGGQIEVGIADGIDDLVQA